MKIYPYNILAEVIKEIQNLTKHKESMKKYY